MFPAGETVTRLRVTTTTDAWNDTVDGDWSTATELPIDGVGVAPRSSTEDLNGRTATITGTALFIPTAGVLDVLPTDRFRVRGVVHEVDGDVAEWVSPWDGVRKGYVIPLKKVEG
jgi:hypothetical protein